MLPNIHPSGSGYTVLRIRSALHFGRHTMLRAVGYRRLTIYPYRRDFNGVRICILLKMLALLDTNVISSDERYFRISFIGLEDFSPSFEVSKPTGVNLISLYI